MPVFDLLGSIFKGLSDPTALAREMAQMNVSPDELMQQVQKTQQLQTMPTAGGQQQQIGDHAQQQPGDISSIFKDLFAPTPTTSQSGQAGSAISNALAPLLQPIPQTSQSGQAGATILQALAPLLKGTGMVPPTGTNGQPPQTPRLSDIMQPATTAPATGNTQAAQALQPMPMPALPQQLQGLPAQLMSAGSSVPPPMPPGAAQALTNPALNNPATGGIQQPQVRSTETPPSAIHGRAGEMESRGMPGDIRSAISDAAQKYGQDPATLMKIAMIESSGNPNAHNKSGAAGLFQFMPGTAKEYGLTDPYDPIASADAGARLMRDNRQQLVNTLGREPTPGELYLAHQQGSGGASQLLSNPTALARDLVGAKAVTQNGGTADMTAQQFANKWVSKVDQFGNVPETKDSSKPPIVDPNATPPVTPPPVDATPTAAAPASPMAGLFNGLDALAGNGSGNGQNPDLNLPAPPRPVDPNRPSQYNVNPQTVQLMMQLLGPMAGGAQIPSLGQLMGR